MIANDDVDDDDDDEHDIVNVFVLSLYLFTCFTLLLVVAQSL